MSDDQHVHNCRCETCKAEHRRGLRLNDDGAVVGRQGKNAGHRSKASHRPMRRGSTSHGARGKMAAPPPGASTAIHEARAAAREAANAPGVVPAPALVAARQTPAGPRVCPHCGGPKLSESMTCKGCISKRVAEINHSGRKAVKLEDLQAIYWSTERAEKDLIPLVLFKGHWSLGYAQSLWNITQAFKAAEVDTYGGAAAFIRENPDITHAAGLHVETPGQATAISDKLWRLTNRLASCGQKIDAETAAYLRHLARGSRPVLSTLRPIDRYSPWSTLAWRRPSRSPLLAEPMPEYWPFFPKQIPDVDGTDLLLAIDAVVPRGLPKQVREDVCQDLVLAVLEGEITASELRDRHQDYIRGVFKRFPIKYGPLSLDAPPPWDSSGRTLGETLVAS